MKDDLTFFCKKPKGKGWSGNFGVVAKLKKKAAQDCKMIKALGRFAKRICKENNWKGVAIVGIEITPLNDTKDNYIKI